MIFIPKKRGFDEVVKIISVEPKWIIKIGLWTLGIVDTRRRATAPAFLFI